MVSQNNPKVNSTSKSITKTEGLSKTLCPYWLALSLTFIRAFLVSLLVVIQFGLDRNSKLIFMSDATKVRLSSFISHHANKVSDFLDAFAKYDVITESLFGCKSYQSWGATYA